PGRLSGFGRIRGGLLFIDEHDLQAPMFYALGVFYDVSDLTPATFGLQAEALSINSGFWAQVGAMIDVQPRPGFMASVGWSVVGIEGQLRWDKDKPTNGPEWALYGKLRIPIRVIALAMQ